MFQVPGVYAQPRPRAEVEAPTRTDVCGFIGFEWRVRHALNASPMLPGPTLSLQLDVASFEVEIGGSTVSVRGSSDWEPSVAIPSPPLGQSRAIAIVADGDGRLHAVPGPIVPGPDPAFPDEPDIELAVPRPTRTIVWLVARADPSRIWTTIIPALGPLRCDDYRDFVRSSGTLSADGTVLRDAVLHYFANGGRRLWLAPIRRFEEGDALERARALADVVGEPGASESRATGLERLLTIGEVSIVDVPDLHAVDARPLRRRSRNAGLDRDAEFRDCTRSSVYAPVEVLLPNEQPPSYFSSSPLWSGGPSPVSEVFAAQRALLERCSANRWQLFLLLSVPRDTRAVDVRAPSPSFAARWREQFGHLDDGDADRSVAALYFPWLAWQRAVGGPPEELPPSPGVAGILARRDLLRGPGVAPAQEVVKNVLGLVNAPTASQATSLGELYAPVRTAPAVNCLQATPFRGVELWGARTLSADRWLRFISVRRTLTAIERRMRMALMRLAFEPNTPLLWMQVTQAALSVLLPVFEAGWLRGDSPEEAFYVRCDGTNNSADDIGAGRLTVEIGVAVAAPMEFLVFRLGRREGVVEVLE